MESRIPPMAGSRSRGKAQKFSRVMSPADRISSLPDPFISHILAFLPTKDAVKTCLLSKRWKFLWTQVGALNFALIETRENDPRRVGFLHLVDNVLRRNQAKFLDKFRLEWYSSFGDQAVQVNLWINLALARDVRVLDLDVNSAILDFQTKLSGKVFICETLECLKLEGPILVRVPEEVRLPRLEELDLLRVKFCSEKCLNKLISGCLVLHSLEFRNCFIGSEKSFLPPRSRFVNTLKVSFPSLRFLEISMPPLKLEIGAPFLESLKYKDRDPKLCLFERPTSVTRVELSLGTHSVQECDSIVKMIQDLNSARSLKLFGSVVKALSVVNIRLSTGFARLIELYVDLDCGDWSSLNVMLECSPNLQVLNLTKKKCLRCTHGECWRDPEEVPRCLSHSLREISFSNFQGFQHEIAMMRYVLKHGVVMRRINLRPRVYDTQKESQILKKVIALPRCSPDCEIHFD